MEPGWAMAEGSRLYRDDHREKAARRDDRDVWADLAEGCVERAENDSAGSDKDEIHAALMLAGSLESVVISVGVQG